MRETFKKYFFEWVKTLSDKKSFFSSKRVERFAFVTTSLGLVIGCFIYLIVKVQLTATETVILISPLLIAAGYNLNQTQKEKIENGKSEESSDNSGKED